MGARPRIVLADDELNLRKVLGAILQRDGYEVSPPLEWLWATIECLGLVFSDLIYES